MILVTKHVHSSRALTVTSLAMDFIRNHRTDVHYLPWHLSSYRLDNHRNQRYHHHHQFWESQEAAITCKKFHNLQILLSHTFQLTRNLNFLQLDIISLCPDTVSNLLDVCLFQSEQQETDTNKYFKLKTQSDRFFSYRQALSMDKARIS